MTRERERERDVSQKGRETLQKKKKPEEKLRP
jgi:hypothetical protein